MRIAVPKEIKNHEYRVGLTPASVRELVAHGHEVWVQTGAGAAIGLTTRSTRPRARSSRPMRPTPSARRDDRQGQGAAAGEIAMLREGQMLYTYLHLAPDPEQTAGLVKSAQSASPTKPSPGQGAACRCWRR
jgi:alanine dehydrogenase